MFRFFYTPPKYVIFTALLLGAVFVHPSIGEAYDVKVLNNSTHAAGSIRDTINQLLGVGPLNTDIIVHRTFLDNTYRGSAATALDENATYYETSSSNATNSAPYQLYSSSFTGYQGDTVSIYNQFDEVDLTHNYALTAPTDGPPPVFHVAPGGPAFGSKAGVEWTITDGPEIIFNGSSLSELTARNAGLLAAVRYDHLNWNWFDIKGAIRQTASNWPTGYDDTNYGFGNAFYASSTALTDGEILLQPPVASVATTSYGQVEFTLYPYKQTRRVKEVLFQFASNPGFQEDELTLNDISTTHGGVKIMEYTDTTATSTLTPIFTPLTDVYFVWFTADDADDTLASFSRIDTYTILGPHSQNEINFTSDVSLLSPSNNEIVSSLPTFTWVEPQSYLGIAKYQLYIDGSLHTDNILGTSTTIATPLTEGVHTWYVVAESVNGATTTSPSTRSINAVDDYTQSQTWYVDNVLGDDNNPGGELSPWKTLTKAGTTAQPGNTVIIIRNENEPYREELTPISGTVSEGNVTYKGVDAQNKPEIWGSIDVSESVVGDWSLYGAGATNTYQRVMNPVNVVATGDSIGNLQIKTWSETGQDTLSEGEWTYSTDTLYYRLEPGEDINTLHIEASQSGGTISCSVRNTFRDIIVRYSHTIGVALSSYCVGERLEVYDSGSVGVRLKNNEPVLKHSIVSGNYDKGLQLQFPDGAKIYNNVIHNNDIGLYVFIHAHNSALRNNVFTDNAQNFNFVIFGPLNNFSASNNNWYPGAQDVHWINTYQGTNNHASTSPRFVDAPNRNFKPQRTSTNIDAGTNTLLTTDVLGNPIYGTPDIGAIEYQPPYQMGTHKIQRTGSVRLYADGMYRYLSATSSADTAEISVTPPGGFGGGDYSEYMNIIVDTWEPDAAEARKRWTASSSYATTTIFTLTDLTPNTDYVVEVDDSYSQYLTGERCDSGLCRTDTSGTLSFTYSEGWSTHTFSVEQYAAPVPAVSGGGGGGGRIDDDITEVMEAEDESETSTEDGMHASSTTTTPFTPTINSRNTISLVEVVSLLIALGIIPENKIAAAYSLLHENQGTPREQLGRHTFTVDLTLHMNHPDVLQLQQYLNRIGFTLSATGPGSLGNETTYFGVRTQQALIRFQEAHHERILAPLNLTRGTGYFGQKTRELINRIR